MRSKTVVLFLWDVDKDLKSHFRKKFLRHKNISLVFPKDLREDSLLKLSRKADVMIGWRPSLKLLQNAENLKLFINPGTGIKHHIKNFRELTKTSSAVLVNGHGHAYATAQHAAAMLLALMNRIVSHHNYMTEGIWRVSDDKDIFSSSVQLRNRKIGLLGYGAINKHVHRFLSGFDNEFNVLRQSWSKVKEDYPTKIKKFRTKDLLKFLKESDILIIAVPQTSLTEDMIKAKELRALGKKGLLVNVARGTIVNETDLYNALKNNEIAGAAIDVWYNYSPKKDKQGRQFPASMPFHKLRNVLLSPHRAASPFNDLSRWEEVFENILKASRGRKDFLNIVDLNKEY